MRHRPTIRQFRLWSGLVLFFYVASHLANHALGLVSLDAMEGFRERIFEDFWRGILLPFLLVALLGHVALAFWAIYSRHSFRLQRWEWAQLLLGFAIPPLLAVHMIGTLGASFLYGIEPTYTYVLLATWVAGGPGLLQQTAMLFVAWLHGCIGLHFWLRLKPWYGNWQNAFLGVALLLPVLAFLGFAEAGRDVAQLAADPAWMEAELARIGPLTPEVIAGIYRIERFALAGFAALLGIVLLARQLREWIHRRRAIRIDYPGGRSVVVKPGTNLLEASRIGGVPHASVCGGRGRCSTCRVHVDRGADHLPPASDSEKAVLLRVGAGPDVRLACQAKPTGPVSITPLLPPSASPREAQARPGHLQGQEAEIAILFADLRAFTAFSEGKLPYDVVFILNRYFRAMGTAVEQAGGHLDKFIGDGVMALFGVGTDVGDGARRALDAARHMAINLDEMNRALSHDLDRPLRIGIGIHAGPAIVGEMGYGAAVALTAVGDSVNTASRIEALTKELHCQLVISESVAQAAGLTFEGAERREIAIRGRAEPLSVIGIRNAIDLPAVDR
jgi:adenylate cyclase